MAKRSRANRTEKATYQNIRNELPERTVVNYMGTRCGHKQKFRIGKGTLLSILEDYKKVEEA